MDLVDQLSQRIEVLVSHIASHPLNCFHLVEHHEQALVAGVAENREHSLKEAKRAEVIDVALDAGRSLDAGSDVRLAREPCQKPVRRRLVVGHQGIVIGPQRCAKVRCHASDVGQPLLKTLCRAGCKFLLV